MKIVLPLWRHSLCLVRVDFALVLLPIVALLDSTFLHELNQLSEIEAHIVDSPRLIGLELFELSLGEDSLRLAHFPHGDLVLGGDKLRIGRVFQELVLVSLRHA